MNLTPYLESLRQELLLTAATEDPEVRAAAERITTRIDGGGRMIMLELLAAAVGEITAEMAPGSVEVRLRGRDPEFVVSVAAAEQGAEPAPSGAVPDSDDGSMRTTLRLPEQLKARVDQIAGREGVSVNSWLVQAVAAGVDAAGRSRSAASIPSVGQSYVGWAG